MKAKLMYCGLQKSDEEIVLMTKQREHPALRGEPVYILRASDYDAAVEQMAKAALESFHGKDTWLRFSGNVRDVWIEQQRAALASLGIRAPKGAKR